MSITPEPVAPAAPARWRDPWHLDATVLDRLSPGARERLGRIAGHVEYGPDEIVMRDGAPTPYLGVVLAGRVGLRLRVPERGPQTIVTIERGELIGWSAVVPPYRATAEAAALEPTTVVAFDAGALRSLLDADPELALELLPMVLGCVSLRLVISWQQLLDLFGAGTPQPW